jgi:hypothetical protein
MPETNKPKIQSQTVDGVTSYGYFGSPINDTSGAEPQWVQTDAEGNPLTTQDGQPGYEDDPQGDLAATLVTGQGYDPAKAEQIAADMLANAGATPNVGDASAGKGATAGHAATGQAYEPAPIEEVGFDDANASGIGIGNTEVTTREVQDEEKTSFQLEGLLSKGGRYIQNARQRAMEMSNRRGQFGSSFAAGAAERAAIEQALPIAQQDAMAYRDAASQNMNALNEFALANLQRATAIDTAVLSANTQIKMANMDAQVRTALANLSAMTQTNIANMDAETRTSIANMNAQVQTNIANMQKDMQLAMQSQQLTHETGLEQLRQEGRMELGHLDADLRERLAIFEHAGDLELQGRDHANTIDLSKLDQEEILELNAIIDGYNKEKDEKDFIRERKLQHSNDAMEVISNYTSRANALLTADMDADAARAAELGLWTDLEGQMSLVNALYGEFPPIIPERNRGFSG